jgi:hypothetical protein
MLASISLELQRQHKNMDAYIMIMHLKELFSEASMTKRNETSKKLFCCKMTEGFSVNTHVLKIIGYIEKVCQISFVMDHGLSVDLFLQSLPQSFLQFIMNYQMNKLDSTLPELLNMLKTAKGTLKKENNSILLVWSSRMSKKKDKNSKGAYL